MNSVLLLDIRDVLIKFDRKAKLGKEAADGRAGRKVKWKLGKGEDLTKEGAEGGEGGWKRIMGQEMDDEKGYEEVKKNKLKTEEVMERGE